MALQMYLETTPAATAPPGTVSNLIDPPDLRHWTITVCACVLALTVPTVLIRLFTKWFVQRRWDWEDAMLLLAQVGLIVWEVLFLVQPTSGADIWNTSLENLARFAYWSNLIIILYFPPVLFAKWAVIIQLSRLLAVQRRSPAWWLTQVTIYFSTLVHCALFFAAIAQCVPRRKIWEPQTQGTCVNIDAAFVVSCFFNLFINAAILAIPFMVISQLQLSMKRKIMVSMVFGVSSLAFLASIGRLTFGFILVESKNVTSDIFKIGYMGSAEIAFLIFAAAFPSTPRFYQWCRGIEPNKPIKGSFAGPINQQRNNPRTIIRAPWIQLDESSSLDDRSGAMGDPALGHNKVQDGTHGTLEGYTGEGILRTVDVRIAYDV